MSTRPSDVSSTTDYTRPGTGPYDRAYEGNGTALDEDRDDRAAFERARARRARPMESVPGLLRRLADELTTLFSQELELFKTETVGAIGDTKAAIGSLATGGAVLFAGFIFLLLAAFLGLALVVEPWLSALIVGGVTVIIGLILTMSGKRKLEPAAFRPRHTQRSLRKDREMVREAHQEARQEARQDARRRSDRDELDTSTADRSTAL